MGDKKGGFWSLEGGMAKLVIEEENQEEWQIWVGSEWGEGEEWIKVLYFNKEQESECKDQREIL